MTATITTTIEAQRTEYRSLISKIAKALGQTTAEVVARHKTATNAKGEVISAPEDFVKLAHHDLKNVTRPADDFVGTKKISDEWAKEYRAVYTVPIYTEIEATTQEKMIPLSSLGYYQSMRDCSIEVLSSYTKYDEEWVDIIQTTYTYKVLTFKKKLEALKYARQNLKELNRTRWEWMQQYF